MHGVRHERRGESRRRLFVIRGFYRVFDRLSGLPNFPGHSGDFRLISRPALDALNALPERNRFVRGLISWVGFRQVSVVYERDAALRGQLEVPAEEAAEPRRQRDPVLLRPAAARRRLARPRDVGHRVRRRSRSS